MTLLKTIIRPDRLELEMQDRMIVVSAANLLEIGEFQFLQLAYSEWFGNDIPAALLDPLFCSYMFRNTVPYWARHYARLILSRDAAGGLDPADPAFHRYDHAFRPKTRQDIPQFLTHLGILALLMMASILVAQVSARTPASRLPPYFEREELPLDPQDRAHLPRAVHAAAQR